MYLNEATAHVWSRLFATGAQPSLSFTPPSLTHKQMPKQSLCDLCKLAVNFLKPYVDNNSTEVRELGV